MLKICLQIRSTDYCNTETTLFITIYQLAGIKNTTEEIDSSRAMVHNTLVGKERAMKQIEESMRHGRRSLVSTVLSGPVLIVIVIINVATDPL